MLDLALFLFIIAFLALGVKRPFLWVLCYLYIDILAPQKIGWTITPMLPVSLIAFCAAFGGWLLSDSKEGSRMTFRQGLMIVLLLYCGFTTMQADFPVEALEKWDWVWKAMLFAIFLPFALRTRLRIEAAALIMVLTAGAIIINAGIKTVLGGGGYGSLYLYVNNNSGIYESSTLATVAIAIIPMILWFMKHGTVFKPDWRVKLFGAALIFACLLVPVGTEARTGLICIAVLAVMLLRDVKRRLTFVVAGAALGVMALPFLPQSFYERMELIGDHQEDQSASTRVAVWEWTIDYVRDNPLGGGFDAFRGNKFTYDMPVKVETGNTVAIEYQEVTDQGRAYHSAIFEMLGEQGIPGIVLWLWIHLLGLWHMERVRHRWRKKTGAGEQWQAPLATALQFGQVIYMVGSLFQGIAYQPFIMMLVGIQIALWSWCKVHDSQRPYYRQPIGGKAMASDAVAAGEPALR